MKLLALGLPIVFLALLVAGACECGSDGGPADEDDEETLTTVPRSVSRPPGTPTGASSSPTALSNNHAAWFAALETQYKQVEAADDRAREQYDPTASPDDAGEYAEILGTPVAEFRFQLEAELAPPPDALEAPFEGLSGAVAELFSSLIEDNPPNGQRIEDAVEALKSACGPFQDFANEEGIEADLNCSFADEALGGRDYYPQVEELLAEAHGQVDDARAGFEALPPGSSDEVRFETLSLFAEEVWRAYEDAADALSLLEAPPEALAAQDAFIAAAAEVASAGELIIVTYKLEFTPAALDQAFALVDTDLEPAIARAEAACADLQSAADDAGVDVDLGCR
jgi:hypothetical protein